MNKLSSEFPTPPIYREIQEFFGPIPLVHGKKKHWRIRIKLPVRGSWKAPRIGLFKPGSHEVLDFVDCEDHHPKINEALSFIKQSLSDYRIHPYDESSLKGDLRYLQLTVQRQTGLCQLVFVANGPGSVEKLRYLSGELLKGKKWHSIWINIQTGSTNTIFGKEWIHVFGEKLLEESIADHPVYFHPACFIQAHLNLFEQVVSDIKNEVDPGKKFAEYYAGVGAIGINLAKRFKRGVLVEINPFAEECFNKAKPPKHLSFLTGGTKGSLELLEFVETVIVDPPRKGLEPDLLEALKTSTADQFIYLSCNFLTLKRDLLEMIEQGWEVRKATGYLLFPNTNHVEVLAILKKKSG